MKFITCHVVFALLLVSVNVRAQADIDYQPKTLIKALQKAGISDDLNPREIQATEALDLQYPAKGKFFQLDTPNQIYYIYIGRVNSCRAGGCSISTNDTQQEDSEYFDYFILFNTNKSIHSVKVFNYQATHGQEITARNWLKQFVGYQGLHALQVDKDIDAISGATISVYAITFDIELQTRRLNRLTP